MIWIQENKGLAAFLGLCAIGCAALAFMAFGSYNSYMAAYTNFESSRKAVDGLEHKSLFPDETSIQLKKEAVDAYANEISELREKLVKFQRPLNATLTGNEFQGRLAEQVERIQELATKKKVDLPEDFRLDFDRWVNQPAPQNAVPKLDFQLEAISNLVNTAIESGISGVVSISRQELAEEKGGGSEEGSSGGGSEPPLLERYPVELVIQAPHKGLENLINSLSNASRTPNHYFIVRLLEIQNEAQEGPLKEDSFQPVPIYGDSPIDPVAPPPVDPTLPPDPGAVPGDPAAIPGGAAPIDPLIPVDPAPAFPPPAFGAGDPIAYRDARVLLGEEELKIFLKVEIIRFKPEIKKPEEGNPDQPGS